MDMTMSNLGSHRCQYNERKIQDSEQRHHADAREAGSSGYDDRNEKVGKPDVVAGRHQGTGGQHCPLVFPVASRPKDPGPNDKEMIKDNESLEVLILLPTQNKKNSQETPSRAGMTMNREDDRMDMSTWDVVTATEANTALQVPLLPQKAQHTTTQNPGQEWYLGGNNTPLHRINRQEQKMDTQPVVQTSSRGREEHSKYETSLKQNGENTGSPGKTGGPEVSQKKTNRPASMRSGHSVMDPLIASPDTAVPCHIEGCARAGSAKYKGFCMEHIQEYMNRHPEQRKFFATCYGENNISSFATSTPRVSNTASFKQSDDQRALYHDVLRQGRHVSRDISFGEGVQGQGYNETPLWSPISVHGRPEPSLQSKRQYLPCRDRECTQPGRPELNGFCEPHAQELRQSFAKASQNATPDVPPRVQALRNSQLKLDISKGQNISESKRYPSSPDVDSRKRFRCITPRCSRWGQSDLQDLCSACYNQTFVDETLLSSYSEELLRDYESMVGNIVTVSKDATRKCRRPGCEHFGNSNAFWFCNECYKRSCSAAAAAGHNSLPCHSCVQKSHTHDSRHRSFAQTAGTPFSAMGPSGEESDAPVAQIRQLMNEPRFGCKATGCGNFGTAPNQGFCNSCFRSMGRAK